MTAHSEIRNLCRDLESRIWELERQTLLVKDMVPSVDKCGAADQKLEEAKRYLLIAEEKLTDAREAIIQSSLWPHCYLDCDGNHLDKWVSPD